MLIVYEIECHCGEVELQIEAAEQLLDVGLRAPRKDATIAKMVALGWPTPTFLPPRTPLTVVAQ